MFYNLKLIFRFWWIVVIVTLITTTAAWYLSYNYLPFIYSSKTTIYVLKTPDVNANANSVYQDLLASDLLVNDYKEMVKSSIIIQTVKDDLKGTFPNINSSSFQQIADSITVTVKPSTRLIDINVKRQSPKEAAEIANKIAEVFKAKSFDLIKTENVSIIDRAAVPISPVSPKPVQNIALGILSGMVGSMVLIMFIDYTRRQFKLVKI